MLNKVLDRIGQGGKTIEGKIIVVLLTLSLSLMAWNPYNIKAAFAADGTDDATEEIITSEGGDAIVNADGEEAPDGVKAAPGDPQGEGDEDAVVEGAEEGEGDQVVDGEEPVGNQVVAGAEEAKGEGADAAKKAEAEEQSGLTFEGSANGVTVRAVAPDGALPEGTEMVVGPVEDADAVATAVQGLVENAKDQYAVDISFKTSDGVKIDSKDIAESIGVTLSGDVITAALADESLNTVLVHVAGDGKAGFVNATTVDGTLSFASTDFSPYVVVTMDAEKTRGEGDGTEDVWTVNFRERDGDIVETRTYEKTDEGVALNIEGALPAPEAREDYIGYWAIGTYNPAGQGSWEAGDRVSASYLVKSDLNLVPDYDPLTYTVTFHNGESASSPQYGDVQTVNVNSTYCVNNIPQVPIKSGYSGKWVYSGATGTQDFDNDVNVSKVVAQEGGNLDVYVEYTKNVFTVTYIVENAGYEGNVYKTVDYNTGDSLTHPAAPALEGKTFVNWKDGEGNVIENGTIVTSDLTLTANFTDQNWVKFIILDESGKEISSKTISQYFRDSGDAIGTLPQNPFVEGEVFEKWVVGTVDPDTGVVTLTSEEVTAETTVNDNIVAVAKFREVSVYDITAEYYYLNDSGNEVIFNTDLLQVEEGDIPYTIDAPASTKTSENEVAGGPIYYASTPQVTVTANDFNDQKKATVRIQYVEYTAEYDFVYMLKDLTGNGYTELTDYREHVYGVLNSTVTATVKTIPNAVFEVAEPTEITEASGQQVVVKYTRKSVQLSYETNGGSYVESSTVPFGSTVNLPATNPTRNGYDFVGWYSDPDLADEHRVTGSVQVNGDTTLYAKWQGQTKRYTIIYMKEVYNESGTNDWVYESSRTANGTVGAEVLASSAPDYSNDEFVGYERDTSRNGTEADAAANGTKVTIEADGSTVLKVYYKLIRYTLIFAHRTAYLDGYGTYSLNNGTLTHNGTAYTTTQYRIENVVLGQNIVTLWPTDVSSVSYGSTYYFTGWFGGSGAVRVTKVTELTYELVSGANNNHEKTYNAIYYSSVAQNTVEYWLQNAEGDWVKDDTLSQTYSSNSGSTLSAKDLDGYDQHNGDASAPSGYTGTTTATVYPFTQNNRGDYVRDDAHSRPNATYYTGTDGHDYRSRQGNESGTRYNRGSAITQTTYRFYYDRAQYDIIFKHNDSTLKTESDIFFEADISEKNYEPDKAAAGVESDYIWDGWYTNSGLTDKFTFEGATMPGNDLLLWAKWNAPTYTVSFVDGDDPSTKLADDKTVEKYKKVSAPEANPTKAGYTFDGWYTSATGTTLFDWNTQITDNTTVYAHWTQKMLTYVVHYVDEDGNQVASDKTVTNPNYKVGDSATEQAIAVAGYRPNISEQSIILQTDNNEITFVYSEKTDETKYTVKYILDPEEFPGNIEIADEKKDVVVPGDTAQVIELAKAVDYSRLEGDSRFDGLEFYPDAVEKTFVLTADENANVFYFKYSSYKHATVTVNYVDMTGSPITDSNGNPIAAHTEILKIGQTFTLSRIAAGGWDLYKAVEGTGLNGTPAKDEYKISEAMAENGLTLTVYYQKRATVTVSSDSKQYDGTLLKLPGQGYEVTGLLDGDSVDSVSYDLDGAESTDPIGRLNSGIATITPKDAVLSGTHASVENYYNFRYISGTLEVTKINVTIRVEPDRWTGNTYNGSVRKTGFTNSTKDVADYVIISSDQYSETVIDETTTYLDAIWAKINS